jgi:hypothetical protein
MIPPAQSGVVFMDARLGYSAGALRYCTRAIEMPVGWLSEPYIVMDVE